MIDDLFPGCRFCIPVNVIKYINKYHKIGSYRLTDQLLAAVAVVFLLNALLQAALQFQTLCGNRNNTPYSIQFPLDMSTDTA